MSASFVCVCRGNGASLVDRKFGIFLIWQPELGIIPVFWAKMTHCELHATHILSISRHPTNLSFWLAASKMNGAEKFFGVQVRPNWMREGYEIREQLNTINHQKCLDTQNETSLYTIHNWAFMRQHTEQTMPTPKPFVSTYMGSRSLIVLVWII